MLDGIRDQAASDRPQGAIAPRTAAAVALAGQPTQLDTEALARTGGHEHLGEMTVAGIIDRFVVEHLEEHADQLEEEGGGQSSAHP